MPEYITIIIPLEISSLLMSFSFSLYSLCKALTSLVILIILLFSVYSWASGSCEKIFQWGFILNFALKSQMALSTTRTDSSVALYKHGSWYSKTAFSCLFSLNFLPQLLLSSLPAGGLISCHWENRNNQKPFPHLPNTTCTHFPAPDWIFSSTSCCSQTHTHTPWVRCVLYSTLYLSNFWLLNSSRARPLSPYQSPPPEAGRQVSCPNSCTSFLDPSNSVFSFQKNYSENQTMLPPSAYT